MKPKFLLVQGRTLRQTNDTIQSFPDNWKDEFPLIKKLGFDGIEWIYDKKSENYNPVLTEAGRKEMISHALQHKVHLENIVFDWFISHPILDNGQFTFEKKIEKLVALIEMSAEAGFKRIILPFLEQNNISDARKKIKFVHVFNKTISKALDANDIELHLETSLAPQEEYELVKQLDHKKVYLCFDMGNSASEGYEPITAIKTVKEFLGSVHIKDRLLHGSSVPLGTGAVRFNEVFSTLKEIEFRGPYSFQVYRNKDSDNLKLLRSSFMFINNVIKQVQDVKSKTD